jgi:hypothetical protein
MNTKAKIIGIASVLVLVVLSIYFYKKHTDDAKLNQTAKIIAAAAEKRMQLNAAAVESGTAVVQMYNGVSTVMPRPNIPMWRQIDPNTTDRPNFIVMISSSGINIIYYDKTGRHTVAGTYAPETRSFYSKADESPMMIKFAPNFETASVRNSTIDGVYSFT